MRRRFYSIQRPFITTWKITAANTTITLPLYNDASCSYTFIVDWGDGSAKQQVIGYSSANKTHKYTAAGTYDIKITGTCEGWRAYETTAVNYITQVKSWGNVGFKTFLEGCRGCSNLTSIVADTYGAFRQCKSFGGAFMDCVNLTGIPAGLFKYATEATNFRMVFRECKKVSSIPAGIFTNCINATDFYSAFYMNDYIYTTSFTSLPENLFAGLNKVTDFSWCFRGCRIKSIPTTTFSGCSAVKNFVATFCGCTQLTSVGEIFKDCVNAIDFDRVFFQTNENFTTRITYNANLFRYCTKAQNFNSAFAESSIGAIPTDFFRYNTAATTFSSTFNTCHLLTSIPANLFRYCTNATTFGSVFYDSKIPVIPSDIFQYNKKVTDLQWALHINYGVYQTRTAAVPVLWSTHSSANGYCCFANNYDVSNWDSIPTYWKQKS